MVNCLRAAVMALDLCALTPSFEFTGQSGPVGLVVVRCPVKINLNSKPC